MTLLRGDILEYDRMNDVLGLHKMEYVFFSGLEFLSEDYRAEMRVCGQALHSTAACMRQEKMI